MKFSISNLNDNYLIHSKNSEDLLWPSTVPGIEHIPGNILDTTRASQADSLRGNRRKRAEGSGRVH